MSNALGFSSLIYQSLPFIGASFGIGIFFSLVYYFYAKMLNDRIVESRARAALFTVFETIGIFVFIFIMNGFFEAALFAAAGIPMSAGTDSISMPHIRLAEAVIDTFESKARSVYISMVISEFVIQTIAQMTSVQIPMSLGSASIAAISMGATSININTGELFAIINNIYNSLIRIVIDVMLMTIARKTILDLAVPSMVLIFPIGLFLRGLYITKRTGSSLIALSLVLFYVYPLSLAFDGFLARQVPAVSYGDVVSDNSASFYYRNLYSLQAGTDPVLSGDENRAMTRSMGELGNKEMVLAPSKYLGVIIAETGAISTTAGFIKAGLLTVPNRLLGWGLQTLVDILAGIMLLGVVDFVSLVTFAFQTVIIQAMAIMNALGMLVITTALDIVMCITTYRIFADVLSGDKSILGLSKVL